jgi:hypothetical protein
MSPSSVMVLEMLAIIICHLPVNHVTIVILNLQGKNAGRNDPGLPIGFGRAVFSVTIRIGS